MVDTLGSLLLAILTPVTPIIALLLGVDTTMVTNVINTVINILQIWLELVFNSFVFSNQMTGISHSRSSNANCRPTNVVLKSIT